MASGFDSKFGVPQKASFSLREKAQKTRKNLFYASPYLPTTSDPKLRFSKNITGFEPRDLIALDSS
jgi:hypothetical protein